MEENKTIVDMLKDRAIETDSSLASMPETKSFTYPAVLQLPTLSGEITLTLVTYSEI